MAMNAAPPHRPVPPSASRLVRAMLGRGMALLPLAAAVLLVGMLMYHFVEGLAWPAAFLNAAMLLGGMGPVDPIKTNLGRWLIGCYALFAGLVFIALAGVMLAPVLHHVLVHYHLVDRGRGVS
jgi:hypothetical protein